METSTVQSADEALSRQTVLDKGEIALLSVMGGDSAVISAARVSNGVTSNASKGEEADQKLINYLMKHRHGTPFEHSVFTFYIKCPLFVRSEWHRHRMASYNEISGRYVEYEPEFYIPEKFRVPAKSNKQGSVYPEGWVTVTDDSEWQDPYDMQVDRWHDQMNYEVEMFTAGAYAKYQWLLKNGVAREMARMVLPANLYTQFYMTVNARALMNFLSLRAAEDAQWEIQQYAYAMVKMFGEAMPMTAKAWYENAHAAP